MNYSNAADKKSIYLQIAKTGKSAFFLNEFLGSQAFILGLIPLPPHPPTSPFQCYFTARPSQSYSS